MGLESKIANWNTGICYCIFFVFSKICKASSLVSSTDNLDDDHLVHLMYIVQLYVLY